MSVIHVDFAELRRNVCGEYIMLICYIVIARRVEGPVCEMCDLKVLAMILVFS